MIDNTKMVRIVQEICKFIVTYAYVGKISKAPGTFGSLATIISIMALSSFTGKNLPILFADPNKWMIFATIVYLISYVAVSIYIRDTDGHDPKEVVIDEFIGQLLSVVISIGIFKFFSASLVLTSIFLVLNFIFFRIFDIFKPWPVSYFDQNFKNAHGVLLDDVFAGIFSGSVVYGIFFSYSYYLL